MKQTYIIKPSHDCQGRGIYLMNNLGELRSEESSVVAQTYIDNPFLIDDLKFDLRLYVVITGVDPLRIYLYDDGLARFATNPYVSATEGDISDLFMHLTNYSINKKSAIYNAAKTNTNEDSEQMYSDEGQPRVEHKRSFKQVLNLLAQQGFEVGVLMKRIEDLIVKTMITGQNYLKQVY